MNADDPEDRTVVCAEFVLGTLTGAERDAFVARLARDPALQAEVGFWQDRLLGLAAQAPAVQPPAGLWQRIEAALPTAAAPSLLAAADPAAAAPQPLALDPDAARAFNTRRSRPRHGSRSEGLWQRLGFWQFVSGVGLAASVLMAVLLAVRAPTVEIHYVAVLQSPDQRAGWVVRASDNGSVRLVPLGNPGATPTGRSWQFWTKGKNAAGPTSLGLVPAGGHLEVPRNRLPDLGDEQLFEITLEPETGSPIGRPTGPVLFVGRATRT